MLFCILVVHVALFLICLDLKKFLDESYDKTTKRQVEIEQKFLQSEKSVPCVKPPRKKKKLNAPKQKDATENCMADLAAQLQLDHFKQVGPDVFSCSVVFLGLLTGLPCPLVLVVLFLIESFYFREKFSLRSILLISSFLKTLFIV